MIYIETPRLFIRDFKMEDLDDLQEIFGDYETMKYLEEPYDKEKTRSFLKSFCIDKRGAFAVVLRKSNKLIGYILFNDVEDEVYEMGWVFNRKFWRQGYAYEACSNFIDYCFNNMKVHKIFAETTDNIKSGGLIKKLGMELEGIQRSHTTNLDGEWQDLYLYGILEPCSISENTGINFGE